MESRIERSIGPGRVVGVHRTWCRVCDCDSGRLKLTLRAESPPEALLRPSLTGPSLGCRVCRVTIGENCEGLIGGGPGLRTQHRLPLTPHSERPVGRGLTAILTNLLSLQ